jgi:hypothetical protein
MCIALKKKRANANVRKIKERCIALKKRTKKLLLRIAKLGELDC